MKANVIKFLLITAAALLATASVQAAEQPAQYAASCGACHAVVASVKNGLGVMPPGGLCAGCSDDDYKALITYMAAPQ